MRNTTPTPQQRLLAVLRGVDPTASHDVPGAKRVAAQQAQTLLRNSPGGRVSSLEELTDLTAIPIDLVDHLPGKGTAFPAGDGWHIHVSTLFGPKRQLRIALHQFKHVLDHEQRSGHDGTLTPLDYEEIADYFADRVLQSTTDSSASDATTDPREEELI